MNKIKIWGVGLILIALLLTGCNKGNSKNNQEASPVPELTPILTPTSPPTDQISLEHTMSEDEYPVVDGSTATIPLSQAVYRFFTDANEEEASADIVHTKTSNAYYRLMNGEADLLIVYEPSDEVKQSIQEKNAKLNMKPIGKDALVFMENASNKVDSLTKQQLIDIYSGKLENWSEAGGDEEDILAFQRPADSGSQTLMKKLVMGDVPMMEGDNVISFESMEGILKAMADYNNEGNTLGYSVFYYAKNMYQRPELKFLKVNGVAPTLETIYDNSYPFINEFYAVIREEEPKDSNAHIIFDWLTGEEGQTLVKNLGYVPAKMDFSDTTAPAMNLMGSKLPENYRYIGESYDRRDELVFGDVTIYGQDWKTLCVFHNSFVPGKSGLIPEDEFIPIGTAERQEKGGFKLMYGLYRLSDNKFILPQVYDAFSFLGDDERYFVVTKDGVNQVIDIDGKVLASGFMQGEGFGVSQRGEYYWIYDYSRKDYGQQNHIYDKNFNYIKTITPDKEDYNKLYEDDGTLYFSNEIFYRKFNLKEAPDDNLSILGGGDEAVLFGISYQNKIMILDHQLNTKMVMNKDTGQDNNYVTYQDIIAKVQYNSDSARESDIFYDLDGKEITDRNGKPYENIVAGNYWDTYDGDKPEIILYREDNHLLKMLNYKDGTYMEINLGDWEGVSVDKVFKDICIVTKDSTQQLRIYKGNKLMNELQGNFYVTYVNPALKDRIVLTRYTTENNHNYYLIIKENGDIIYQSRYAEELISVDPQFLQINRGNYSGVIDYNGNFIVKELNSSLSMD